MIFRFSILICFVLSLHSCVTILNKNYKTIHVTTDTPTTIINKKDTFYLKSDTLLRFQREKKPILLYSKTDSLLKEYYIPYNYSSTLYWNLFPLVYTGIPGLIVDAFSPKKFSYPHYINLHPSDTTKKYSKERPTKKGDVFFNISLPFYNQYNYSDFTNDYNQDYSDAFGLGVSMDIYTSDHIFFNIAFNSLNNFFNVQTQNSTSSFSPVLFDTNYQYYNELPFTYSSIYSNYGSISMNKKIQRLSIGGGLSCSLNSINKTTTDYAVYDSTLVKYNYFPYQQENLNTITLGAIFTSKYEIGKFLNLGFYYKPSFYRLNAEIPYRYEHYLGFDLHLKIKVSNKLTSKQKDGFFSRNFGHLK
jgi:hypothetical protein